MKRFLRRFTNRDKLAYVLLIAFGLFILVIEFWFQFARTTFVLTSETVKFDYGMIAETHLWIRIIEMVIGTGILGLGIERLIHYYKQNANIDKK